ncbi:MAG: NRDE family protein [Sinobacteraceae bacterium]|nr:NRDE family protein [Nevskiaceae bacterium]
MCLLVLAWHAHPRYRLVVAANRDEFHERPAAPVSRWPEPPGILAGRDLQAGGTWLGIDPQRRFGVVTNFRELQRPAPTAPSRGELIPQFLHGTASPSDYLAALQPHASTYSGFNLLLADRDSLWYGCNRLDGFARHLDPGIYGLSNEYLDTPWPKLQRVRQRFTAWVAAASCERAELFELLADTTRVADAELPRTGLTIEWERILSSPFVAHPQYGTRCSTVLLLEHSGALRLHERRFDAQGSGIGDTEVQLGANEWL